MNAHLIKAICVGLQDELGGNKVLAYLAGVSPSVWSDYCNFDKPDCTIPLHRALRIEERTGRRDFTAAMTERDVDVAPASASPLTCSASALQALATAQTQIIEALADGRVTEAEKRGLLAAAQQLVGLSHDLASSIAGLTTASPVAA